jgi:hypothetical protein
MTEPTLRQRYGYLPAALVLVLEAVGEDVMLRLVAGCGGTRIWLARPPRPDSRLALAVGMDDAMAIHQAVAAKGITHIDVPLMTRTLERDRQQRILTLRAEGTRIADIARTVGMSERGVYLALARARSEQDDRQLELFGT